jgi:hypothetical protein
VSDQKICPTCGTEYPLSMRFCDRDGTALRSTNALGDLIGSVVAERYHILKKLGEGGMGTVYLAEHVKMGRKAALKVMNPGMNQDSDAIARFNREAANASRLNHPNVCAIYDFGETPEGLIYLAMEFIEGDSLTAVIEKNGTLAAPRAASIIHQAADALSVAHDYGIVHRDLKPDNIMISRNRDGSDLVKVVDFGIAKASSSDAQKVTKTGLVVGTPEYMSPEQLAGDKLDGRSDIYSLGLVAFNCLTGKLPFPSNSAQEAMIMRLTDFPKTLGEMKPDVEWPVELQNVMDKALARDADERYQKAADFGREMAKAVENMPASVAAGEGTMVMGAAGAAAKTAAAPAVPATRVAGPKGETRPVAAAEAAPATTAPATKRSAPMLVGAVVLVAAIGGGIFFMKGSGAKAADPAATTATVPVNSAQVNNQAGGTPGGTPGGKSAPSATPGTAKTELMSKPVAPGPQLPAGTQGAPAAGGGAPTLEAEIARLEDAATSADYVGKASKSLTDIARLLPSAVGPDKGDLYYYQSIFLSGQKKDDDACDAVRRAVATGVSSKNKDAAKALSDGCK